MLSSIDFLENLLKNPAVGYDWNEINKAIHEVISSAPTEEIENLLLKIITFKKRIHIVKDPVDPRSLSPENLLKVNSLQYLVKYFGKKYFQEIKNIKTKSYRLNCAIKKATSDL